MPVTGGLSTVAAGASGVVLGSFLLGAVVIYDAGAVRIRVHEKKTDGENIRLIVPAAVVPLAMRLAPDKDLRKASKDVQPYLPALKIAAEELAKCPDGPLVQVTSSKERVSIVKRGGSLEIDVDSPEETVHISFPLKMVHSVARRLEAVGPPA
ncbi:MAG TPA: hypothetical protein VM182_12735 [Terriglobia bacterium]|nr:hypothetical protein [Terriglobia bacterium]